MRVYLPAGAGWLLLLALPLSGQQQERPAKAREAAVSGTVTILGTQRPLPTALVRLLVRDVSTVTDSLGAYRLTGLEPGPDTVQVHYLSYESEKIPVRLEAGRSVRVDVEAAVPAAVLKGLEVEISDQGLAGFRKRSRTGRGYYLNREQIDSLHAGRAYQLFRKIPVTWSHGQEVLLLEPGHPSKLCIPLFYVDGRRRTTVTLDDFLPWEIEAIEVYRWPLVPAQFTDPNSKRYLCGSVVLWTRRGAR